VNWLHRYATFVMCCTVVLIAAGGMVTSTGSGLSVPDWPTSYGWNMFTFPLKHWVGGIRYEHSHRLIASTVGMLILTLAVWLWRAEPRVWVRRLGYVALFAVVTQGILGGITVLWFLPDPISIAHAGLAQLVFCLTLTIAIVTSPAWTQGQPIGDSSLQTMAAVTTAAIYVQILIGATMRHTGAGLAIPDFPLAFGHIVPPVWSAAVAIHYTHRVGALVVSILVIATAGHVLFQHRARPELRRPALLLLAVLAAQVTLGALTVLTGKQYVINSLHVVTGAAVLGTSLVLTLRAFRPRFEASGLRAQGSGSPEHLSRIPDPGSRIPDPRGARA
jgi:heme a synthase